MVGLDLKDGAGTESRLWKAGSGGCSGSTAIDGAGLGRGCTKSDDRGAKGGDGETLCV